MDPGEPRRILEFTADTSRLLGRWGAISTVFVIKTWRYGRLVARRGAGAATERADDARAAHPGDACDLCERKYLLGNSDYGGPACAGASAAQSSAFVSHHRPIASHLVSVCHALPAH